MDSMVDQANHNTSAIWESTAREEEVSRNSESESENEWTDILVTEQGLDTKTRKIHDDLEEPDWDKKVDDIIWEDDEPVWNENDDKSNVNVKTSTSTDNLTKMKNWPNVYKSSNSEIKIEKSTSTSKGTTFHKNTLKRKMDLFGLDIGPVNEPEWQIVSNLINFINTSSYTNQVFLYSALVSFLVLYISYFSSSSTTIIPSHGTERVTLSPITALTAPSHSMALIPHYNKNKNRELALYATKNENMLIHRPRFFARNIRHLKHLGVISDCTTEMYSVDSYLFIASCTFGILLFPQSMT